MSKKQPAIPLKEVMGALDRRDRDWYMRLPPEKQKSFNAWMMMRYASSAQGSSAPHYIFMVNELVNKNFSDISKHPELQWLLLSACGAGRAEFHPYIKPPNARKKQDKISQLLAEMYPWLKADEIDLMITINDKHELRRLAADHGIDDKTIRDIFGK